MGNECKKSKKVQDFFGRIRGVLQLGGFLHLATILRSCGLLPKFQQIWNLDALKISFCINFLS
jgi:hypothetical protein